ncbi:MAG: hypothetical protein EOO77_41830 [Oxalobacteraceae bacterium]|nr:MAG: hypothetical protein EOO77_41830 [Oxalobacteraceae bacterium]
MFPRVAAASGLSLPAAVAMEHRYRVRWAIRVSPAELGGRQLDLLQEAVAMLDVRLSWRGLRSPSLHM